MTESKTQDEELYEETLAQWEEQREADAKRYDASQKAWVQNELDIAEIELAHSSARAEAMRRYRDTLQTIHDV